MKKYLTILVVTLLAGCSVDVTPSQIEWGKNICANNGGLSVLEAYSKMYPNAQCGNGARFVGLRDNWPKEK